MASPIPRPRVAMMNRFGEIHQQWIRYFESMAQASTGIVDLSSGVTGVLPIARGGTGSPLGPSNLTDAQIAAAAAIAWTKISKAGASLADIPTRQAGDLTTTVQAYAPVWTGSVSNPTLGNGALAGSYVKIGSLYKVTVSVIFGSTTTAGSGAWSFTLPIGTAFGEVGSSYVVAGGAGAVGAALRVSGTTFQVYLPAGIVGSALPSGWVAGDSLAASLSVHV